jgi:hypothetical protein
VPESNGQEATHPEQASEARSGPTGPATNLARSVWDDVRQPAVETEKQPWAFSGLALIETLAMLPLVKCFLRPLIPVAAAHLIAARQTAVTPSRAVPPP